MDLLKIIRELHEERDRIDRAIASLEALLAGAESGAPAPAKRRGRKGMSDEERKQVAKRMREYWRRKKGNP
jgi:hypothetical protein